MCLDVYLYDQCNDVLICTASVCHVRERRGVHSAGAVDRIRDCGGGVLAVGQLLVTGAGGRAGGRVTSGGGRVHARVAPAVRGAGGPRRARPMRVRVAGATAAASRAPAHTPACRHPPVPRRRRRLPRAAVCARATTHPTSASAASTTCFLTGAFALLSCA